MHQVMALVLHKLQHAAYEQMKEDDETFNTYMAQQDGTEEPNI